MPTQHIAALLGATSLIREFRHRAAMRCKWSNLSPQHPTCRNTWPHGACHGRTHATCCAKHVACNNVTLGYVLLAVMPSFGRWLCSHRTSSWFWEGNCGVPPLLPTRLKRINYIYKHGILYPKYLWFLSDLSKNRTAEQRSHSNLLYY